MTEVLASPRLARRRTKVLIFIPIAVLLCGGLATFSPAGQALLEQYPASFSAPEKLQGLVRTRDPALRKAEEQTVAELRDNGVDRPYAVYYEDPVDESLLVAVIGSAQLVLSPASELAGVFALTGKARMRVDNRADVDAGPLGGVMQCGSATVDRKKATICAWADHGSVGVGMFFGRGRIQSADLLRAIRAESVRRS